MVDLSRQISKHTSLLNRNYIEEGRQLGASTRLPQRQGVVEFMDFGGIHKITRNYAKLINNMKFNKMMTFMKLMKA